MEIKHLLRIAGKTKQELADFAGITTNTIRAYEKGSHQPPINTCVKMAQFLNCSLETLADWNTENIIDKRILSEDRRKLLDEILNLDQENVSSVLTFIQYLNSSSN